MAQEPCPFNDLNNELQAIPHNSEPRTAYIRLHYDWSTEISIDLQHWQPHLLAFHQNDTYTEILELIEKYLHEKLFRLEPETCDDLDLNETCIVLQLTVEDKDVLKRHACAFDASGASRLRYFRDLYESEVRPELDVFLRAAEDHGKRRANGLRVEIRTRGDVLPGVQYFAIGSVEDVVNANVNNEDVNNEDVENEDAENKHAGNEDVNDEDVINADVENQDAENQDVENQDVENHDVENQDIENQDAETQDAENEEGAEAPKQIPNSQRLIKHTSRFFWKCSSDAAQAPVVVQVPAWKPGATRICETDDESTVDMGLKFPDNFEWNKAQKRLMESAKATSFESLLGAFRSARDNGELTPYDFARNSRLTYTFWDESGLKPDVPGFPEGIDKSISVGVRFVQHLESLNNSTISFVQNGRHELVENSGYYQVKGSIINELRGMPGAQALFNYPQRFESDWDLQLWVNSQGFRNLFKLKPGRLLRHFFEQKLLDQMNARLYLEAHIVPRGSTQAESMPTDQPTDAVLDDVGDDQLHIRFTYDLRGVKELSSVNRTSQVLHFQKARSFRDLYEDLAAFVESKLENDQLAYWTYLRETQSYILMRPVLDHPCPLKRRAFAFDDSGFARVSTIDDLVSDAVRADGTAETDVKPQLHIKLAIVEDLRRNASTDPMVVIRSGAVKKDPRELSQFFRIGSVPKAKSSDEQRIATSHTFFWRRSLVIDKLMLMKSGTWSLRNFEICNPDEGKQVALHQESSAPSNIDECKRMLLNGSISPFLQGRLLYSFKTFGEELCCPEPVDAVPSSGLSVALRFISHLRSDETSRISFNDNSELSFEETDNFGSIQKEIMKGLGQKLHGETKALFKFPLENSWYMQFWILPQVPDGITLYRYSADISKLHCFLNKSDLDKGDTTLFMEVHLLPKPPKQAAKSDYRGARAAERARQ